MSKSLLSCLFHSRCIIKYNECNAIKQYTRILGYVWWTPGDNIYSILREGAVDQHQSGQRWQCQQQQQQQRRRCGWTEAASEQWVWLAASTQTHHSVIASPCCKQLYTRRNRPSAASSHCELAGDRASRGFTYHKNELLVHRQRWSNFNVVSSPRVHSTVYKVCALCILGLFNLSTPIESSKRRNSIAFYRASRSCLPFLWILPTAAFPLSSSSFTIWISQTVYCYFWAYPSFYFLVFFCFYTFLVVGFLAVD